MQYLEREGLSIEILGKEKETRESFSGHKGAKATLYNIKSSFGIFFGIFPNYIHSQVFELDEGGKPKPRRIAVDDVDPNLFGAQISDGKATQTGVTSEMDDNLVEIKEINHDIINYQEELMRLHQRKNQLIDRVNDRIDEEIELDFDERVVLKSLIVYGFNNITHIAELLNKTEEEIHLIIKNLKKKRWIKDKKIVKLENVSNS
jgi:predicted transcriptional regulator